MVEKGREAIILAGGFGTRLKPLLADLPKAMAPVRGKPFLTYLLDLLESKGFTHIIISIGFLGEKVKAYYGDFYQGMRVEYAYESEPLGTGGGIAFALSHAKNPKVFVFNGDTLFDVDCSAMESRFEETNSVALLALRELPDISRYGGVKLGDDGLIRAFQEKGGHSGPGLMNGGVYLIDRELFSKIKLSGKFSMEKDVFEAFVDSKRFAGLVSSSYFIDIGVPEDYIRAQTEFERFEN